MQQEESGGDYARFDLAAHNASPASQVFHPDTLKFQSKISEGDSETDKKNVRQKEKKYRKKVGQ